MPLCTGRLVSRGLTNSCGCVASIAARAAAACAHGAIRIAYTRIAKQGGPSTRPARANTAQAVFVPSAGNAIGLAPRRKAHFVLAPTGEASGRRPAVVLVRQSDVAHLDEFVRCNAGKFPTTAIAHHTGLIAEHICRNRAVAQTHRAARRGGLAGHGYLRRGTRHIDATQPHATFIVVATGCGAVALAHIAAVERKTPFDLVAIARLTVTGCVASASKRSRWARAGDRTTIVFTTTVVAAIRTRRVTRALTGWATKEQILVLVPKAQVVGRTAVFPGTFATAIRPVVVGQTQIAIGGITRRADRRAAHVVVQPAIASATVFIVLAVFPDLAFRGTHARRHVTTQLVGAAAIRTRTRQCAASDRPFVEAGHAKRPL
jgi:hypothetical protein